MRLISPTYQPPVALTLRLLPLALAAAVVLPAFAPAVTDAGKASPDRSVRRTPVVEAIEKVGPAVVNIYTETIVDAPLGRRSPFFGDPFVDDFFSDFFGEMQPRSRRQKRSSLGSGLLVDADGTIVTNEHVILRATSIRVLMSDGREFDASLQGADSDSDLAVLHIDSDTPLPFVPLPSDDSVMIGETVVAIGNPFGLSHSVTTGVISAAGRTINAGRLVYHGLLQTDASINPGNSGGPLVDVEGRLLGINTAIHRDGEGIGFAIPSAKVRIVVEQILNYGSVQPAWLGLKVQGLTGEIAFHLGVDSDGGVLVRGVEKDSPAAEAGVAAGDIIGAIDGDKVHNMAQYQAQLAGRTAGETLEVGVLNDGVLRSLKLQVAVYPAERIDRLAWQGLGLKLVERKEGPLAVSAVRENSPAAEIGIRPGDGISSLGGREVADRDAFRRRLAALRNSNAVLVSVVRGRNVYRVTLPLKREF
ncbi:MAG: trypsin-like peptidase domain-containing protein [bacterium]